MDDNNISEPMPEEAPANAAGGAEGKKNKKNKAKKNSAGEAFDWLQSFAVCMVAVILVFSFALRGVEVFGASMEPTFHEGDRLLLRSVAYTPRAGDVVVISVPEYREKAIIKRVIATQGQTVDINFETGAVYVDGTELHEDYIKELTHYKGNFSGPITVPEGCAFVMGDNRNNSTDSRSSQIGCVDYRQIMGRAFVRIAPVFTMIER